MSAREARDVPAFTSVELAGAKLTELVANDVLADVGGSGSIFITVSDSLHASVSGSGAILYSGNPQHVTRSITGSGVITGS